MPYQGGELFRRNSGGMGPRSGSLLGARAVIVGRSTLSRGKPGAGLARRHVCYRRAVSWLRWLSIFLFWAALDLSGPLLFVPAEVFEESEEAAHRSGTRRREQPQPDARSLSARVSQGDRGTAQRSRVVTATRGPRSSRSDTPPKLPLAESPPDSAPDDH
jgi:hypothetical protein